MLFQKSSSRLGESLIPEGRLVIWETHNRPEEAPRDDKKRLRRSLNNKRREEEQQERQKRGNKMSHRTLMNHFSGPEAPWGGQLYLDNGQFDKLLGMTESALGALAPLAEVGIQHVSAPGGRFGRGGGQGQLKSNPPCGLRLAFSNLLDLCNLYDLSNLSDLFDLPNLSNLTF